MVFGGVAFLSEGSVRWANPARNCQAFATPAAKDRNVELAWFLFEVSGNKL